MFVTVERIVSVYQTDGQIGYLTIEQFGKFVGKISLFVVVYFVVSAVFLIHFEAHKRADKVARLGFGEEFLYNFFSRVIGGENVKYVIE